jgi:hypothetical protein
LAALERCWFCCEHLICKSVRRGFDEVAALRGDRGFDDLRVGRVGPAVTDVFHGRAMKQRRILRHDGNGGLLSCATPAISCPSIRIRPPRTS